MTITLAVANRTITTTVPLAPVGGNVESDTLTATFDEEWDGLRILANFAGGAANITAEYVDGMFIPYEALAAGRDLWISFTGLDMDGTQVLHTVRMDAPIPISPFFPPDGVTAGASSQSLLVQLIEAGEAAEAAADGIDNMQADVVQLPAGDTATVDLDKTSDPWRLTFGIPGGAMSAWVQSETLYIG